MEVNVLRRWAGALLLLAAAAAWGQGTPHSYALISEMARDINVVSFQGTTGSRLDGNQRQKFEVPEGTIEKFVLFTARAKLASLEPAAELWLMAPLKEDLFPRLQNPALGSKLSIPEDLAQALREQKSTHLLIFTPHRDEADFSVFIGSHAGAGSIEGVGFYVDRMFEVEDPQTRLTARGYLAAFAYFRVTLAEAATGKVLWTKHARAYEVQPATRAKNSPHPWDAMTAPEKVQALRRLIEGNINTMLTEAMAAL